MIFLFLSLYSLSPNLSHLHGIERLLVLYVVLLQHTGMAGVPHGGVHKGLTHRWGPAVRYALCGVKPQRVEYGQAIVVILTVDLTSLHCPVAFSLPKNKQSL